MDLMTVLKNLEVIYRCTLGLKKWPIALQTLELQAKYESLFGKQYFPPQCVPVITHTASMAKQQRRNIRVDMAKLGLALRHPPPACV